MEKKIEIDVDLLKVIETRLKTLDNIKFLISPCAIDDVLKEVSRILSEVDSNKN